MPERICVECGAEFITINKKRCYGCISRKIIRTYDNKRKNCIVCMGELTGQKRLLCSAGCEIVYRRVKQHIQNENI